MIHRTGHGLAWAADRPRPHTKRFCTLWLTNRSDHFATAASTWLCGVASTVRLALRTGRRDGAAAGAGTETRQTAVQTGSGEGSARQPAGRGGGGVSSACQPLPVLLAFFARPCCAHPAAPSPPPQSLITLAAAAGARGGSPSACQPLPVLLAFFARRAAPIPQLPPPPPPPPPVPNP